MGEENYSLSHKNMTKLKGKKIIFIDMDGTLIKPLQGRVFPKCISDFSVIWNTWNSLRNWAKDLIDSKEYGWVFIVTNQGGIESGHGSKKYYLEAKLNFIKLALQEYLDMNMSWVTVDYTYCSSNDKNDYYRKPNPGMLEVLARKYSVNSRNKSEMIMIGDASGIHNETRDDFSDSDLKVAENYNIDYLDYNELC